MSHWVLLVAPLVLASFVMLLAFVGCTLDSSGLGTGDPYLDETKFNSNSVSVWRLDDPVGTTTAADSKGNNDGTYMGGVMLGQPGLLTGNEDAAATFDGSTGFVTVPHVDDTLNPAKFTVEALVDVAGGEGTYRAVVSSRDIDASGNVFGYILYAGDQNRWEAWVGDGTVGGWHVATGPDITPGTHYLAMTYDGQTLNLYVDPKDNSPAPAMATYAPNATRELRIGAGANEAADPLYFFNGTIDEVAVYNIDLEFSVIQRHFGLATTGATPE